MSIRIPVTLVKCVRCNVAVDQQVMNLTTNLGPPEVECHWCGARVATGRLEWHEMRWQSRTWFFVVTLLYLVVAYFLGGLSVTGGIQLLKSGKWPDHWGLADPAFWVSGGVTVALVALIQGYRIYNSRVRQNLSEHRIRRRSSFSFEVGGQARMLQVVGLFPAVCWIVSRFRLEPRPPWAIPLVFAVLAAIIGFPIWRRSSRRKWSLQSADDQRAASELFELITQNIDTTQSQRWSYVLKDIPEREIHKLTSILKSMGFTVDLPRIDKEHEEYFVLTVSEECIHTVDSYIDQLTNIDYFAKSQKLELADCSVGR